jgi:hypothetical protein
MTDSRKFATLTICGCGLGFVATFLSTAPSGAMAGGLTAAGVFLAMLGSGWALLSCLAGSSLAANRREEAAIAVARAEERQRLRARRFDGCDQRQSGTATSGEGERKAA